MVDFHPTVNHKVVNVCNCNTNSKHIKARVEGRKSYRPEGINDEDDALNSPIFVRRNISFVSGS